MKKKIFLKDERVKVFKNSIFQENINVSLLEVLSQLTERKILRQVM